MLCENDNNKKIFDDCFSESRVSFGEGRFRISFLVVAHVRPFDWVGTADILDTHRLDRAEEEWVGQVGSNRGVMEMSQTREER